MEPRDPGAGGDSWQSLRANLHDILDSLPNGVMTVDSEWRVTSLNLAARQILGVAEESACGRPCHKIMHTDDCFGECPLRVTLETGQSVFDYEVCAARADGRPLQLRVNTAVLRDVDGRAIGGVVSFRDATQQEQSKDGLLPGHSDFHGMIGRSRAMQELYLLLEEISDSCSTVLIEGESGTGKELVARAVQRLSPRRDRPFVRVNCGAFSETLLESELFGHVRGAFTDAHRDRPGRFELADTGTVFLDEVGESSPAVQLRLLRVLQEQEFERVGGNDTISVDVRVIAATHRPLAQLVQEGQFREDLFYRLNVLPVVLPPLRERPEDIHVLAERFLQRHTLRTGRAVRGFSPRALARMVDYPWPGNVRELENAIEHACVRCRGNLVQETHLPAAVRRGRSSVAAGETVTRTGSFSGRWVAGMQGDPAELLAVLQACRWNRHDAARSLGISRSTLWRRMVSLGLTERAS